MQPAKRKKLERAGFKIGTVQEFLDLSDEDMALIELKIRLVTMVKVIRESRGVTQHQSARLIESSQSRIAKMEAASADVSLDLICKALFALGVSHKALGKMIGSKQAA